MHAWFSDNIQKVFPGKVPFAPPLAPTSLFPPQWLPGFQSLTDATSWRDLWLRPPVPLASPAPEQDQPMDLTVRPKTASPLSPGESEADLNIDVGVEEPLKQLPIDLSVENASRTGDIRH